MCFFFNDPATTEIYTLSLHDALPILGTPALNLDPHTGAGTPAGRVDAHSGTSVVPASAQAGTSAIDVGVHADRKSTRLNSSHGYISYAVFCLKKKKKTQ